MENTSSSLFKPHSTSICIGIFLLHKLVLRLDSGYVTDVTKSTRFRLGIGGTIWIRKRVMGKLPSEYFWISFENLCRYLHLFYLHWKEISQKNINKGKSILLLTVRSLFLISEMSGIISDIPSTADLSRYCWGVPNVSLYQRLYSWKERF